MTLARYPALEPILDKIVLQPSAVRRMAAMKRSSNLVMMKGVFDLFHIGHLISLASGASLGDSLVVAVATDESVRQRKGPTRPIVPMEYRAAIISALPFVTAVTSYGSYSPYNAVRSLRPHFFAASHFRYFSDEERLALKELGVTLTVLDRPAVPSTSDIVQRIMASNQGVGGQ